MADKIRVSMVGCCLVDRLYNNISFSDSTFSGYLSKNSGDGGLTPGQLVFKEEFEKYVEKDFSEILKQITNGKAPDKINIGGPGIVPLIHTSQMLNTENCECLFYGCGGKDADGKFISSSLEQMNLSVDHYLLSGKTTPATDVLSDPGFDNGNGERIFINSIAAAWDYSPSELNEDFFASDIVVFGGTALVPNIHDNLTGLLKKAKSNNCLTIVNTVYDFRNEKANPEKRWPLGESDASYQHIDLLITDSEEALRLSGASTLESAIQFFQKKGACAVIITNGSRNLRLNATKKSRFQELNGKEMPVSNAISEELKKGHVGDTTGCGDNFVGGVIASLVTQIQARNEILNLTEATIWGIVSGGYSCFYIGGTFMEKEPGEKRELIAPFYNKYINQRQK
jgi:sugar/nucleoside kinase (ribokinase family)